MAATTAKRTAAGALDDYGIDINFDPFADSGGEDKESKKRKNVTGLGIEEEVAVAKKQRVPKVKLDENRLLSEKGIPRLRRKAGELKFKGKGHEFSDTARLLSFYQLWLDDLFPKAKFLDALAMVEKTGHKGQIRTARMEWIDEGKPNYSRRHDDTAGETNQEESRDAAIFPARIAPIFQTSTGATERPTTPDFDDIFGDDEIYDATPKAARKDVAPAISSMLGTQPNGPGNGEPDDEEDLDALMAEEEAQRTSSTSLFGNGEITQKLVQRLAEPAEEDLDALMAEMEADSSTLKPTAGNAMPKASKPVLGDEEDDLDALMAEAEAQGSGSKTRPGLKQAGVQPAVGDGVTADEEEAMAEMEGLW